MARTPWRSTTRSIAGREDFVYRIAVGELPFVTGIFPLGGKSGDARPRSSLHGWNLPRGEARGGDAGKTAGVYAVVVRAGE